MARWVTVIVFGIVLSNTVQAQTRGSARPSTLSQVAQDSNNVFRPVGSTRDLLTSESRRFWQSVFGWYRVGETVTRVLTRDVVDPPARVIRLAVFGRPARPQPIDSVIGLFIPRIGPKRVETSPPSTLLAP